MGAFLFIVLEEYYKGYFKLGPGNAVSNIVFHLLNSKPNHIPFILVLHIKTPCLMALQLS